MCQRPRWLAIGLVSMLFTWPVFAVDQAQRAEIAEKKAEALEQHVVEEGNNGSPTTLPVEPITKPGVQAVDPSGVAPLDDAITCLARSIYWEAKGQDVAEMEAVASVVMNRLAYEGFPRTVCEVVRQGSERGSCQFSWWCDGRPDSVQEEKPYELAKEVARRALNQQIKDPTRGALYFHHRNASPSWATKFTKTLETDAHAYYKP